MSVITFILVAMSAVFHLMSRMYQLLKSDQVKVIILWEILSVITGILGFGILLFILLKPVIAP